MTEELETPDAPDDDAAIAAEVSELTQSPSDQQAERIKSALIAAKKGEKAANKRIKELEPIAARATEIDNQLAQVQPVIQAVMTNPKLRAEALRMAGGTHTSAATTEQPLADDDPDASAIAEELNMYLADGVTPDVARGRRVLTRLDARTGRVADERIRPLAGVTLDARAQANLSKAMAETDEDGTPMATEESIREVAAQLPAQLLADPKVVDLVLNSAIGIDRRKRRTPKAAPEPLYFSPAGQRRQTAPTVSADDRRAFAAAGLTDEDVKRSMAKLEKAGGKAVVLGS